MTPYIVKHPAELAAHTDHETRNATETHKAFTEDELNRYLDKIPVAPPPDSSAPAVRPQGKAPNPTLQSPKARS
jgi:hypothetical protein